MPRLKTEQKKSWWVHGLSAEGPSGPFFLLHLFPWSAWLSVRFCGQDLKEAMAKYNDYDALKEELSVLKSIQVGG